MKETPDYFSFPFTEADALDEYRLRDQRDAVRDEEKVLRKKASEALKAANAKKKQVAFLEKKLRVIDQKRRPQWYGVDCLTPAQQAEWKAHVASGVKITDEAHYKSRPAALLFCAECAKKPELEGMNRVEVKSTSIFSQCADCEKSWGLKFAIIASPAFIQRKIDERAARRAAGIPSVISADPHKLAA